MKKALLTIAMIAFSGAVHAQGELDTISQPKPQPQRLMPPGMAMMVAAMDRMRMCRTGKCTGDTCPAPR